MQELFFLKKEIESKIDQHHGIRAWEALAGININNQQALAMIQMIGISYRGDFLVYLHKNYQWANHLIQEIKDQIKLDCSGKLLLLRIEKEALK